MISAGVKWNASSLDFPVSYIRETNCRLIWKKKKQFLNNVNDASRLILLIWDMIGHDINDNVIIKSRKLRILKSGESSRCWKFLHEVMWDSWFLQATGDNLTKLACRTSKGARCFRRILNTRVKERLSSMLYFTTQGT